MRQLLEFITRTINEGRFTIAAAIESNGEIHHREFVIDAENESDAREKVLSVFPNAEMEITAGGKLKNYGHEFTTGMGTPPPPFTISLNSLLDQIFNDLWSRLRLKLVSPSETKTFLQHVASAASTRDREYTYPEIVRAFITRFFGEDLENLESTPTHSRELLRHLMAYPGPSAYCIGCRQSWKDFWEEEMTYRTGDPSKIPPRKFIQIVKKTKAQRKSINPSLALRNYIKKSDDPRKTFMELVKAGIPDDWSWEPSLETIFKANVTIPNQILTHLNVTEGRPGSKPMEAWLVLVSDNPYMMLKRVPEDKNVTTSIVLAIYETKQARFLSDKKFVYEMLDRLMKTRSEHELSTRDFVRFTDQALKVWSDDAKLIQAIMSVRPWLSDLERRRHPRVARVIDGR